MHAPVFASHKPINMLFRNPRYPYKGTLRSSSAALSLTSVAASATLSGRGLRNGASMFTVSWMKQNKGTAAANMRGSSHKRFRSTSIPGELDAPFPTRLN